MMKPQEASIVRCQHHDYVEAIMLRHHDYLMYKEIKIFHKGRKLVAIDYIESILIQHQKVPLEISSH